MRFLAVALSSIVILGLGCVRWGFEAGQAVVARDASPPDADVGAQDLVVRVEALGDSAAPLGDGPRDSTASQDSETLGDGTPESAPLHDSVPTIDSASSTDTGPTLACNQGMLDFTYPGSQMAICRLNNGSITQCQAAGACNESAGWRLCTASQFLARGGATTPGPHWGWIAGCIREGADAFAPVDRVCSACDGPTTNSGVVSWHCETGGDWHFSDSGYIGLTTSSSCVRAGEDDARWEGYWTGTSSQGATTTAACCD